MTDNPHWASFADQVISDLIPMIDNSALAVALLPRKPEDYDDVRWCVQLGAMIMLDKPIIVVVMPGSVVPDKLVRVADHILELNKDDPNFTALLAERVNAIMGEPA